LADGRTRNGTQSRRHTFLTYRKPWLAFRTNDNSPTTLSYA
jgi:hypothetical protein